MYLQMDKNKDHKLNTKEDYQRIAKSTYKAACGYYLIFCRSCDLLVSDYDNQIASIVAFSCELFLKSILYNDSICCRNEHNLFNLYNKLSKQAQKYIKEKHPKSNLNPMLESDSFEINLKEIGHSFRVFRYSYEKEGFACNIIFLLELFITLKNYCDILFNDK